jgi:hypothetical protein
VFNAADVAAVLNKTPAGQALLARLKAEFDVYLADVHSAVKDPATGKMVAGPGNPNLQGGYAKGTGGTSGTRGVIVLNRLSTTKGSFKGTDAEFWAYVLVQEVNEHDLHWGKSPGNSKTRETTNRVETEKQAAAMGLPEGQSGYRDATGAPDTKAIKSDVAGNSAYQGATHGNTYVVKNKTLVVFP